jgi:hypothetical protein
MTSAYDLILQMLGPFGQCVRLGGHDFKDGLCSRCTTEQGAPTLLDVLAEAKRKNVSLKTTDA